MLVFVGRLVERLPEISGKFAEAGKSKIIVRNGVAVGSLNRPDANRSTGFQRKESRGI
jgi:hypothetical protein